MAVSHSFGVPVCQASTYLTTCTSTQAPDIHARAHSQKVHTPRRDINVSKTTLDPTTFPPAILMCSRADNAGVFSAIAIVGGLGLCVLCCMFGCGGGGKSGGGPEGEEVSK